MHHGSVGRDVTLTMPESQEENYDLMARRLSFRRQLHTAHVHFGHPLPPALTGFPAAGYSPQNSKWWSLELTGKLAIVLLEDVEIDLFELFELVSGMGGFGPVTDDVMWQPVAARFGLPDESQFSEPELPYYTGDVLRGFYRSVLKPLEDYKMREDQQRQRLREKTRAQHRQIKQEAASMALGGSHTGYGRDWAK